MPDDAKSDTQPRADGLTLSLSAREDPSRRLKLLWKLQDRPSPPSSLSHSSEMLGLLVTALLTQYCSRLAWHTRVSKLLRCGPGRANTSIRIPAQLFLDGIWYA